MYDVAKKTKSPGQYTSLSWNQIDGNLLMEQDSQL